MPIYYGLANFQMPSETPFFDFLASLPPMQTPEGYEKQKVKKFLNHIGAYHFWPVQTGYGAATVDCLACIAGRFYAIEVKKEGYRPSDFTKRQQITMQELHCAGATVIAGDGSEIVSALKKAIGYVTET